MADGEKRALEQRVAKLEEMNRMLMERLEQQPMYPPMSGMHPPMPGHPHPIYPPMGYPPMSVPPAADGLAPPPKKASEASGEAPAESGRAARRRQDTKKRGKEAGGSAPPAKRHKPPPGETLRKYSRTPSRTPAPTDVAPVIPEARQRKQMQPAPHDARKVWYTEDVLRAVDDAHARREEQDAEGGAVVGIPKLWRLPGGEGTLDRILAGHGIGPAKEASLAEALRHESCILQLPNRRRQAQRMGAQVAAKPYERELKQIVLYNTLIQGDYKDAAPLDIAALAKALLSVPDRTLKSIDASIAKAAATSQRGPKNSFLVYLHSMLTILVWYSAEAVADTLEVCSRLIKLKLQKVNESAATIGQPEMLEATSRLLSSDPKDHTLAFPPAGGAYVLPDAVARVRTLAGNVHSLLSAPLKS
eukprot:TRINITY_DN6720_c0_g3_i1.p1 TRINITY_DN6720_c0_g3~~TRINITY_DN6720_c0_g3_i1.p1  ORF type:complete len:417 (+),score=126.71 TRINITY_DN6720_c0_g3_i1:70-1320(+)